MTNTWKRQTKDWLLTEGEEKDSHLNVILSSTESALKLYFNRLGIDRQILSEVSDKAFNTVCHAIALSSEGYWNASVCSFWKCAEFYTPYEEDYIDEQLRNGQEPEEDMIETLETLQRLFQEYNP